MLQICFLVVMFWFWRANHAECLNPVFVFASVLFPSSFRLLFLKKKEKKRNQKNKSPKHSGYIDLYPDRKPWTQKNPDHYTKGHSKVKNHVIYFFFINTSTWKAQLIFLGWVLCVSLFPQRNNIKMYRTL